MATLPVVLAGYYGHHHDSAWMAVWGTMMMLLFVAVVAVVIWAIVRKPPAGPAPPGTPDHLASARAILAERYARGEIDREEYRQKVADLG